MGFDGLVWRHSISLVFIYGVRVVIVLVQEVGVDKLPTHHRGAGDEQDGQEHVSCLAGLTDK